MDLITANFRDFSAGVSLGISSTSLNMNHCNCATLIDSGIVLHILYKALEIRLFDHQCSDIVLRCLWWQASNLSTVAFEAAQLLQMYIIKDTHISYRYSLIVRRVFNLQIYIFQKHWNWEEGILRNEFQDNSVGVFNFY